MEFYLDKIGTDPEFFISRDGQVLPSWEAGVEGDKGDPYPLGDSVYVQRDNVALELNIAPSGNADEFISNIGKAKDLASDKYNVELLAIPSLSFTDDQLDHYEAVAFGCDPDYNAYTQRKNSCQMPNTNLRAAGGHVHVSYGPKVHPGFNRLITKLMDVRLALPAVLLDPDKDRRQLYGTAGSYRDKDYGLEYRSLSNFWLESEELQRWVFESTELALREADALKAEKVDSIFDFTKIQEAINDHNDELAKELCIQYDINMPK